MTNTFGGGFGGDFDDLLPRSSPVPPNIGNPFEDPFADIGKSQESDPWATYAQTKSQSPTAQYSQSAFYEPPQTEAQDQPSRDSGFGSLPTAATHETTSPVYSTSQLDDSNPFSTANPSVDEPEYRPTTPTLPGPLSAPHEPPTPPADLTPAPAVKTPTIPISPSKAGLFDDSSSSTFGTGFVRRHKAQRSSSANIPSAAVSESRTGSLFASSKADPLEALVSKARSASVARTPTTPKLEDPLESKGQQVASNPDPLEAEPSPNLPVAEPPSQQVDDEPEPTPIVDNQISPPSEDPVPVLAVSDTPTETKNDGVSTPMEAPAVVESTPTTQVEPMADEPIAPLTVAQPPEDTSITPTPPSPPSRAASESLAASQYPEGSTYLHSPGPGAYTRVVSPLDTPAAANRNLTQSFSGLALGGEVPNPGWNGGQAPPPVPDASLSPTARTAGWGAVDATEGWGGESHSAQAGWGGETNFSVHAEPESGFRSDEPASASASEHSRKQSESNASESSVKEPPTEVDRVGTPQQSVPRAKDANGPFSFAITVGDPQKVGDSINPYIVYTVSTKTNSPNYRKPQFSVLRRYSDFLWLFETLSLNKPGVFIPPIPEKQGFGRFQGAFVEARRLALNTCLQKIANHPLLGSDEDFKFFIESDSFALDVKHRKAEIAQEKTGGFLSSITGPKFYETDEWFDTKRSYIDALESQLRGLAKSVETVSKSRAEVAAATGEFAEMLVVLSNSDLSKQLSQSLAALADVHKKARKLEEEQSQDDIILLMGIVDEYIRLIGSVRLTFASRIRLHAAWQNANSEAKRVRTAHDKARRQGRIPQDRVGMSMHEMAEAEKRAADAKFEFDQCSRLIKAEMARFEKERIDDFKKNLEALLEGMIQRQQDVIESLENYQEGLLRRSKSILGQPAVAPQGQEKPVPPEASS